MYKGQSGMWSWLFHRVTGLGLLLFLFIHIVDISLLSFGPTVYNGGIQLFDLVIVRLLSLALVGAAFYHAFNGVRIILIDFWSKGVRYQRSMFAIVVIITILVFIPIAFVILAPALSTALVSLAYWFVAIPGLTVPTGH
jgi:succinate dehydrogenase / fumarate reductase cytochrome b subunit